MNRQTQSTAPRLGIVLSSGGVRGVFAHTGFLLAFDTTGFEVSAVSGCSAGAVVGGVFASGTPILQWANSIQNIQPGQFWRPRWLRLVWSLLVHQGKGCTGFSSSETARDFFQAQLKAKTFEECKYPFHALAINVATGKKTIFSQGTLAPRIVASAAIPLLYQPVEIGGEFYSDGALLDLAPTDAICCQHNLDILIIHHVAQRTEGSASLAHAMKQPWTMIEILNRLLYRQRPWYLSDKAVTVRRCPCGCGALVIVLEPVLPPLNWPVTKKGVEVLQSARQQAAAFFATYQEILLGNEEISKEDIDETDPLLTTSGCQT